MAELRKLEICVPHSERDRVVQALQNQGGLSQPDHVGENLVVLVAENCTMLHLVCTQRRAGQLISILTSKFGLGIDFGTISSVKVASARPDPEQLLDEFRQMQARISATIAAESHKYSERSNYPVIGFLKSLWPFKQHIDEPKKFKYVTSSTTKSVEELWNEIVSQSKDDGVFYTNLICATIISAIGLMSNSSVVVLSAMLISPMMGPILAGSFGLAIGDEKLVWASVFSELRAASVTFLTGAVMGLVFGPFYSVEVNKFPTQEMSSRGDPAGLLGGIVVAIASGVVIGNAITTTGINSLIGAAISASLLPPVVNSGILFVFRFLPCNANHCDKQIGFLAMSAISMSLYLMNYLVIFAVAYYIFYLGKVGQIAGNCRRIPTMC
jgi:uncharacterized hydrophobic protein (TIGR00271 family)